MYKVLFNIFRVNVYLLRKYFSLFQNMWTLYKKPMHNSIKMFDFPRFMAEILLIRRKTLSNQSILVHGTTNNLFIVCHQQHYPLSVCNFFWFLLFEMFHGDPKWFVQSTLMNSMSILWQIWRIYCERFENNTSSNFSFLWYLEIYILDPL